MSQILPGVLAGVVAAAGTIIVGGEEVQPIAFADFKNGVYTLNGSPCAITDIFVANGDFGAYAPSDVVAGVGLVSSFPTLKTTIGNALVASGYTVVMQAVYDESSSSQITSIDLPDYDQELYFVLLWDNVVPDWIPALQAPGGNVHSATHFLIGGRRKAAVSVHNLNVWAAISGITVMEILNANPSTLNTIGIYANNSASTPVETWGIYPLQTPEELTALSAD